MRYRAALVEFGNLLETESWIGSGHAVVKKSWLSPANLRQLGKRGHSVWLADKQDVDVEEVLSRMTEPYTLSPVSFYTGEYEAAVYLSDDGRKAWCCQKEYAKMLGTDILCDGYHGRNPQNTVMAAGLRPIVLRDILPAVREVAAMAATVGSW